MNTITPMKPWKTPILRVLFFVLGAIKPLQSGLKNLSLYSLRALSDHRPQPVSPPWAKTAAGKNSNTTI
jgi:hypothetical protein